MPGGTKSQFGARRLFHSDWGIEYADFEFREQLAKLGMLQSMSRAGKMNDKPLKICL